MHIDVKKMLFITFSNLNVIKELCVQILIIFIACINIRLLFKFDKRISDSQCMQRRSKKVIDYKRKKSKSLKKQREKI